jgi:hypothetical protein
MARHPDNTNLTLIDQDTFCNLPIQQDKGPFAQEYLERLLRTMNAAIAAYPRVFAFRADIRFPAWFAAVDDLCGNAIMTKFIKSFKSKIKHNRHVARRMNPYAHDSYVRCIWAREQAQSDRPHYHVVFLLNQDAFCSLGYYELGRDNIFNRLCEAWASALGLPVEAVKGLVEIPSNSCYNLHREDPKSHADFFYRASYLCKVATKVYGDGTHGFGASWS